MTREAEKKELKGRREAGQIQNPPKLAVLRDGAVAKNEEIVRLRAALTQYEEFHRILIKREEEFQRLLLKFKIAELENPGDVKCSSCKKVFYSYLNDSLK